MEHYRKIGDIWKEKKEYKTQDEAIDDAKIINKNLKQIHKVVPYRCSVCNNFHLGKNKTVIKHEKDIYKS